MGVASLEQKIQQFEELLEEMREATRTAHEALKQLRLEKREVERYLQNEGRIVVEARVNEVVKNELDKIAPEVKKHTNLIYEKIGQQLDKIIGITLGKELSTRYGTRDLRPELAEKLREWIQEIMDAEFKGVTF